MSLADPPAGDPPAAGDGDLVSRAWRLLRWYPRTWRERYGEEFTELLLSDLRERPRSARRTLDVARGGTRARLAVAGLAGCPRPAATAGSQVSASLGSLGGALGVFLVFAAALWSQLLIAAQWEPELLATARLRLPDPHAVGPLAGRYGFFAALTSAAMVALLVLAAAAALPVLATVAARVAAGRPAGLIRPAIVLAASVTALVIGGRVLENHWLGTGGHHALVPSGLAAFVWANTVFASAYWGHPALFGTLLPDQRAWMALSPFVLAAAVASAALLVRRARISPRVAMFEARLGLLACVVMAVFVVGYGVWAGAKVQLVPWLPLGISVGVTSVAITVILVVALAVAAQGARLAIAGLRPAGS